MVREPGAVRFTKGLDNGPVKNREPTKAQPKIYQLMSGNEAKTTVSDICLFQTFLTRRDTIKAP